MKLYTEEDEATFERAKEIVRVHISSFQHEQAKLEVELLKVEMMQQQQIALLQIAASLDRLVTAAERENDA